MNWYKETLEFTTNGKGLHPITNAINNQIHQWEIREGMCYLFLAHTSASLVMSENYDPTAKMDLEEYMERLVPEGQKWFRHTLEGDDDATSHIRAMLTDVSLTIPVENGSLLLGTWQGVYLFEHRKRGQRRKVVLRCLEIDPTYSS